MSAATAAQGARRRSLPQRRGVARGHHPPLAPRSTHPETLLPPPPQTLPLPASRRYLESLPADKRGPLWGVPFAVKDNIDVADYPTTCACPDFAYTPKAHARTVQALIDAGAVGVFGVGGGLWVVGGGGRARCRRRRLVRALLIPPTPPHTQAASLWARPTWISLRAGWWARARPMASPPTPLMIASPPAAPPRAQRWRWRRACAALRWAPTPRDRVRALWCHARTAAPARLAGQQLAACPCARHRHRHPHSSPPSHPAPHPPPCPRNRPRPRRPERRDRDQADGGAVQHDRGRARLLPA